MKVVIKKVENKITENITLEQYEIITRNQDMVLNAIVENGRVMDIREVKTHFPSIKK